MIDIMERSHDRILGLEVIGKVKTEEMKQLSQRFEQIIDRFGNANLLVKLEKLPGMEPGVIFENLKQTFKHWNKLERVALVGDAGWLETYAKTVGKLMPRVELRYFERNDLDSAWRWLETGQKPTTMH